jgi:DNA-binding XRE family transcriptional regulator
MTQEDVAYKLQIEQTVLSKIERGVKKPSLELAQRLAIVLGLPDNALS